MSTLPAATFVCPVLIGRAVQLEALERAVEGAGRGRAGAVVLSGEAGIGKSRLAAEAMRAAREAGFEVLRGDCYERGRSSPFSAILELLRGYVAGRSPADVLEDLGPAQSEVVKLLPEISALAPDLAPSPALDAEQEKRRLFHALYGFLGRVASRRPLFVLLEDLHWGDETTLEFVEFMLRQAAADTGPLPLMVLMTYRSDETGPPLSQFLAEVDRQRSAVELPLGRLSPAETEVMMRSILATQRPVRRDYIDLLHEVTGGNPFFIEEVLKSSAVRPKGEPGPGPIDMTRVPRTVQEAVRQRAAHLSVGARRVLDLAVAGARFDMELIAELTQDEAETLAAQVKELLSAQLVVEDGPGRFSFRHALTRQAIYTQLVGFERRQLHGRIAEALERLQGGSDERLAGYVSDIAQHYFEAEVWEKAVHYSERAGRLADDLHTPRAVIQHLGHAQEAARRSGARLSPATLRLLANAMETVGELEGALATMQSARDAARELGDRQEEWRALIGLGIIWSARDYAKTGDFWAEALALARTWDDERLLAHSLNRVGNWHVNVEQPSEGVSLHEQALAIFEGLQDQGGVAETLDLLGMAWFIGGDMVRSRAHYERALPLFRQQGNSQGYCSSLATLADCGPVYHTNTLPPSVTLEEGAAWLEDVRQLAVDLGWRAGESYALWCRGLCLGPLGEYGSALDASLNGIAIAEDMGHLQWVTGGLCALGSVQMDLLELDAARDTLERAYACAIETGSLHWRRCAAAFMARCHLRRGDLDAARRVLEETLPADATVQTLGARAMRASKVELAIAMGDATAALALLDAMDSTGSVYLQKLRGEALALAGDRAGALEVLRAAAERAEQTRERGLLWRIRAALSHLHRQAGERANSQNERAAARTVIDELAATLGDPERRLAFVGRAEATLPAASSPTERQAAKAEFGGLTEREREIASRIARGMSNAEIAGELVISERTVETHVSNILAKLGFGARSQVAAWAVQSGLQSQG